MLCITWEDVDRKGVGLHLLLIWKLVSIWNGVIPLAKIYIEQMKVHIGCDHAGFELKERIKVELVSQGYEVSDHGTYSLESTDYPDYAHATAEAVQKEVVPGILICGSANGVCMTANKHQGIRAALCWNKEVAALARLHNDANIICLPARFLTVADALEMVDVFLKTEFEGGRHQNRVSKIACPL